MTRMKLYLFMMLGIFTNLFTIITSIQVHTLRLTIINCLAFVISGLTEFALIVLYCCICDSVTSQLKKLTRHWLTNVIEAPMQQTLLGVKRIIKLQKSFNNYFYLPVNAFVFLASIYLIAFIPTISLGWFKGQENQKLNMVIYITMHILELHLLCDGASKIQTQVKLTVVQNSSCRILL